MAIPTGVTRFRMTAFVRVEKGRNWMGGYPRMGWRGKTGTKRAMATRAIASAPQRGSSLQRRGRAWSRGQRGRGGDPRGFPSLRKKRPAQAIPLRAMTRGICQTRNVCDKGERSFLPRLAFRSRSRPYQSTTMMVMNPGMTTNPIYLQRNSMQVPEEGRYKDKGEELQGNLPPSTSSSMPWMMVTMRAA